MGRSAPGLPYIGTRSGRYYAIWYDPATRLTRRSSLGASTPGEAETSFALFLLARQRNVQPGRSLPLPTDEALRSYLREHVAENCADKKRQEDAANNLIAYFGPTLLADIDIPMSRAYADARRAGKIGGGKRRRNKAGADSTIRRELVVLRAAARHALRWKRIDANQMPSVEYPSLMKVAGADGILGEAAFFSREQVQAIFAQAEVSSDEEMPRFVRLLYYTGARRRSIENLTVGQVKLSRRKIYLATPGKKRTGKRQPVVPIFDEIMEDARVLCEGKAPGDRLFRPRSFYRDFVLICRMLGFGPPNNPHLFRHSRATHLLQDGMKIYDVATLLGDTMKTVEANYGHHTEDDLRRRLQS